MTPRVAVVAGPDPGHALPAVSLGLALKARGCAVLFVSGDRWADAVTRAGLEFAPIRWPEPQPGDDSSDFGWVLWELPKRLTPGIAETLREWRPGAAVVDTLTVAGWWAADLLGIPRIELVPHGLQLPSKHLPPPGTGLAAGRTPVGWLRDAIRRRDHLRSCEAGMAACRASRLSLGLPPEGPPAARLVATLPGLEPRRKDWPERTYVVGPLEWDPADADLPEPPGEGPLVFLVDSSASDRPQTLLALAAEGLRGLRVACTRFGDPVPGLPDGFVAGPGRQAPLLGRAACVVTAGGHGTVAKALVRGLPLVVVPGPGDQKENAMRVARHGAGVCLTEPTAAALRGAVERVLARPSYAAAARRLAATAEGLGPDAVAERVLTAAAESVLR